MKEKIITFSFIAVIVFFFLCNLLTPDKKVSWSERRYYQSFPDITFLKIQNKEVMNDFDKYALDQFILRDVFRSLKAHVVFDLLRQLDNHQIFVKDNMIFKIEYPNNESSIKKFIEKMQNVDEKYLTNNKVYYSIIPDKNYYLNNSFSLNLDYDALYQTVRKGLSNMEYIELRDVLSLSDYYRTDTHWRQEKLSKVVKRLGEHMKFQINETYEEKHYKPFYGVYYGQSALQLEPDDLIYLENEKLKQVIVENYEKENVLYNKDKLGSMDSYDVFLSGATPLVTIENPNQTSGKELIIFRDSYGSSLAPLLTPAYSKITLIDLRYMTSKIMESLVTFQNQDVLILYSTMLVNNSASIKD